MTSTRPLIVKDVASMAGSETRRIFWHLEVWTLVNSWLPKSDMI